MPYITKKQREFVRMGASAFSAGELNYQFTMLALKYLKNNGYTYARMNDVVGAFEAAKLEFYRRVVVPYENKKIVENGDCFPEAEL
jgi:hypothetical protein